MMNRLIGHRAGTGLPLRRHLSFWLLLLILFGATANADHHHGDVAPSESSQIESTISDRNSDSTTHRPINENDCTICQLQRNLHVSLHYNPVQIIVPLSQRTIGSFAASSYFFAFH